MVLMIFARFLLDFKWFSTILVNAGELLAEKNIGNFLEFSGSDSSFFCGDETPKEAAESITN